VEVVKWRKSRAWESRPVQLGKSYEIKCEEWNERTPDGNMISKYRCSEWVNVSRIFNASEMILLLKINVRFTRK
jgi:hypothetical protein